MEETDGRRRAKSIITLWFTPQKLATIRTASGHSRESGIQEFYPGFPCEKQESNHFCHPLLLSQGRKPGIWNVAVTSGNLTELPKVFFPKSWSWELEMGWGLESWGGKSRENKKEIDKWEEPMRKGPAKGNYLNIRYPNSSPINSIHPGVELFGQFSIECAAAELLSLLPTVLSVNNTPHIVNLFLLIFIWKEE